jgi:hypothetical protein
MTQRKEHSWNEWDYENCHTPLWVMMLTSAFVSFVSCLDACLDAVCVRPPLVKLLRLVTHKDIETCAGVEVYFHVFLTSALVEWSFSRPGRFTPWKESRCLLTIMDLPWGLWRRNTDLVSAGTREGRNSSVGTATVYGLNDSASYPVGTGSKATGVWSWPLTSN